MHPLAYFASVREAEPGAFIVTFPDVPEAITQGDTEAEAIANAPDALSAALEGYLEVGRAFPARSQVEPANAAPGRRLVDVPVEPAIAARGLLVGAMRAQGLTKVGLAARIGKDEKVVRRILSGKGASLDLTIDALKAVGVRAALAV